MINRTKVIKILLANLIDCIFFWSFGTDEFNRNFILNMCQNILE